MKSHKSAIDKENTAWFTNLGLWNTWLLPGLITDHHPSCAQKDDHAEDVDHTGCEHSIPRAKQHRLRDEEVGFVPWLAAGGLKV